jgi:nitrite reductase/ring-hydroxylating ferredoxin subunit
MQPIASPAWTLRPNAPAAGQALGPIHSIPDGQAKEFTFGTGVNAFRMLVVRKGGQVFGYLNLCPHYSLPLNHRPDEFMTRDGTRIMCRQHLALFRIEDGACLDGACEGRALDPVPLAVRGEMVVVG